MNTKRIIFWLIFIIVLGLIVWGLTAAMNKAPISTGSTYGTPAAVTATDHVRGSMNAPVTLIEYGDFQCPACGIYFPYVEKIFNQSSTTMRLVFRNFPLPQHANAIPAALAAEAAGAQGKYWEMYSMLYANQKEWSEVPDASPIFEKYATQIGLSLNAYKASLKDPSLKGKIVADKTEGDNIGIDQTPTFFLNGKLIRPNNYDEFKSLVQKATQ